MRKIQRKAAARGAEQGTKLQTLARSNTVLAPPTDDDSEHYHQVWFVSWFRKTFPDVLIFAIPNGGGRSKAEGARLKAEGVTPGIPDLYVPAWKLWIEMKKPKKGRLSAAQVGVKTYLLGLGDDYITAYGFEDAKSKTSAFYAHEICAQ